MSRTRVWVRQRDAEPRQVALVLIDRDPDRFAQYAEYAVYDGDRKLGTITGGAITRFSHRLGRRVVTERSWSATPGFGAVDTRREALEDLLRATDSGISG